MLSRHGPKQVRRCIARFTPVRMPSCRVFKEQHATAASPSHNLVRSIIFRSEDTSKLGPRQAPHVPASCSCCIEILFFFVFFFLFLYIFSVLEFYLKECFNICGDVRSRIVPRIALHEVAFLVQKELFEVALQRELSRAPAHWVELQYSFKDQLSRDATSPRFQTMWPLPSVHVCKLLCPWAPLKGPLHIILGGRKALS